MDTVQCFLCSDDLCSSTSRINVRGRSSFPIEEEIKKLPISARIDDNTRICPACLRKLRKKKSLEENLQEAIRDLVKNHNPVVSMSVEVDEFNHRLLINCSAAARRTQCLAANR